MFKSCLLFHLNKLHVRCEFCFGRDCVNCSYVESVLNAIRNVATLAVPKKKGDATEYSNGYNQAVDDILMKLKK